MTNAEPLTTNNEGSMTYDEAIQFWFGRINYEQRSPKPSDLKLDRMRALLELLGNPQQRLRIVHVAGSKGKGSTSAMLAAILRQAGYRTGLFTSPHLCRVEERIQVDDVPISANELAILMAEVRTAVQLLERGRDPGAPGVTFFEVATALGFLHFVQRRVEVAVIEVGLGGRFDSTNVCQPLVSLITSISFDHVQQLGNTLVQIAMEKAGIVKPRHPAISGARDPGARAEIERICRQRHSPLRQLGVAFHYTYEAGQITPESDRLPRVRIVSGRRAWPAMELGLFGEHQAANAAVVVATVEELRALGLSISDRAVAEGLRSVQWPARLEVMSRRPLVILDCAHNLASAQALVDTLQTSLLLPADVRRFLIFAGSNDKDLSGMLELLAPHFDHFYLTHYNSPRSVPPEQLARLLAQTSTVPFTLCPTTREAWSLASGSARPQDLICATGSVFLAGELRPLLLG
jgi:dihydrofolate synthase/folylpolyglutamate synthase